MLTIPVTSCRRFFLAAVAGDPLQAAPVKVTDTSVDRMVFDCAMWRATFEGEGGVVHCLTGCHRQSRDSDFQDILDRVRWGRADRSVVDRINATWTAAFDGLVTKLRIKKSAALDINTGQLATIEAPEHRFMAQDVIIQEASGLVDDPSAMLRTLVDLTLSLKLTAAVVLTRKLQGLPAGTRGTVTDIVVKNIVDDDGTRSVKVVSCDFGGCVVCVEPMRFSAYDSRGVEVAFCMQLPLLLGWAITVHRSQGMTLDAVEIDFDVDTWSTSGLIYTALSRVRSFSALRVRGLRPDLIRVSRCAVAYFERQLRENNVDPSDDGRPGVET